MAAGDSMMEDALHVTRNLHRLLMATDIDADLEATLEQFATIAENLKK